MKRCLGARWTVPPRRRWEGCAAIDAELRVGEPLRTVGGEEVDHVRDVPGCAGAAQGDSQGVHDLLGDRLGVHALFSAMWRRWAVAPSVTTKPGRHTPRARRAHRPLWPVPGCRCSARPWRRRGMPRCVGAVGRRSRRHPCKATVRRRRDELIILLATRAPRLDRALKKVVRQGGRSSRSTHPHPHPALHREGRPANYSGKHRSHGLHFLTLTDVRGRLSWISAARPAALMTTPRPVTITFWPTCAPPASVLSRTSGPAAWTTTCATL